MQGFWEANVAGSRRKELEAQRWLFRVAVDAFASLCGQQLAIGRTSGFSATAL